MSLAVLYVQCLHSTLLWDLHSASYHVMCFEQVTRLSGAIRNHSMRSMHDMHSMIVLMLFATDDLHAG